MLPVLMCKINVKHVDALCLHNRYRSPSKHNSDQEPRLHACGFPREHSKDDDVHIAKPDCTSKPHTVQVQDDAGESLKTRLFCKHRTFVSS